MIFDTTGTYTLAASDGSMAGVVSNSFPVNPAAADHLVFGQQPSDVTAGVAISPSITVYLEDPFGNIVTSDTSSVTLVVSSGGGTVTGTSTVAAVSGVATFDDAIVDLAGVHTLEAVDGALSSASSTSFTVSTAAASQVAFVQQPTDTTAGSPAGASITVDVEDQFGNLITGDNSNVTLYINTGPGSIGGTDTVAASAGVATFNNIVIDTAGSYTLSASDGSLAGATSGSFSVTPAAAEQLAFVQQPTATSTSSAVNPAITVSVEDQFGNTVTSDSSQVTLSVQTGPGSIGGVYTVAASGGVATFGNVTFATPGGVYAGRQRWQPDTSDFQFLRGQHIRREFEAGLPASARRDVAIWHDAVD